MPGKPHSRLSALTVLFPDSDVSASASTGHCSDTLCGKWSLSLIICSDCMPFIQTSPHQYSHVCNMAMMFYFSCEISSWALYSSLLFSYKTTRSRNQNNWGQSCPCSYWKTRWSLALSYRMKSPPAESSFWCLTELCIQAERSGCTVLPPVPLPAAISPGRPRPTLSGRLEFLIFHQVQFYFFSKFHYLVCLDVFSNGPACKLTFSSHSKPFFLKTYTALPSSASVWHTKAHLWYSRFL